MSNASLLRRLGFCLLVCALFTTAAYAQFSVMYTYGSNPGDPVDPQASTRIAQGREGNLYSTAFQGGANGQGAAFTITASGALTVLYSFCSQAACADGTHPEGGLTLGTDGDFYGTTSGGGNGDNAYGDGVVFKMTSAGALTVIHVFTAATDGNYPYAAPVEGLDGNFYGTTSAGGAGGCGTIYKVTPSGSTFTVLHTFANQNTDACSPHGSLVLGTDGNFYGTASYGAYTTFKITPAGKYTHLTPNSALTGTYAPLIQAPTGSFYGGNGGQIFKMTMSGGVSILHTSSGSTDPNGYGYNGGLAWASDGNLYGDTQTGGTTTNCSSNLGYCGVIFKMTTGGAYMNLHDFENPDGYEGTPVIQHTNGIIYGQANFGGVISGNLINAGTFWKWDTSLKPFVSFMPFTGHVGDQIQIFGQGFTSSSVVKFNGVVATHTLTGSTFITATVPQGTLDGYITVTTGGTTLKSLYTFLVHDSWGSGAAMPTARFGAFAGAIGQKIYVIGGATNSSYQVTNVNEIYNTKTNTWTAGAPDPTARELGASAVVNGILYVIGGSTSGSNPLNLVEAYNPVTNSWTTKSPMPTARNSVPAVVYKNYIYVIGGYDPNTQVWYDVVERYDTTTDTWTEEAPLPVATAWEAVGLLGTTIVSADGNISPGTVVGTNEGYNPTTNAWKGLTADPTPRLESCFAAISGQLYVAGGSSASQVLTLNEGYNGTTKAWTTLTPMPQALATPGSATVGGRLYCFGGANFNLTSVYNNLQIYQP